jgi:Ca-activated chloride channel homolog
LKRTVLLLLLALAAAAPALADKKEMLSKREQKDRIAKLADRHRQFLIDVEPIIQPAEKDSFLRLETDPQRDSFIEDFWRRRDIAQGTTNHSARDDYYGRIEYVRETFEGTSSDRGRVYLIHGPPQGVRDINCPAIVQPIQIWYYAQLPELGRDALLLFYKPANHREFRLWDPFTEGQQALMSADIARRSGATLGDALLSCRDGEYLLGAVGRMQADMYKVRTVFSAPKVNEEDVHRALRSAVIADPKASKLNAQMTVAYPHAEGLKTDTQLTILVPRAELKTTTAGGVAVYTIDVVGEILRDEKMWEKYRYRFDFPGTMTDETFPIVIDRLLRPAEYKARVKVTDASSGAQAILESELKVPEIKTQPTEESTMVSALHEDFQSTRARLRIVPLGEDVTSGLRTIQTLVSGQGISSVEFWLDGKRVATRRAPPYTLDLDFGTVPRPRRIRAVALDSHDKAITGDEIVVNTGTDPFRVRITSPRIAPKVSGQTRVEIDVRVPEGKQLEQLDLYYNEQRVATLFDPPFVQTVNIPGTDGVGYLRAVGTLKNEPETDPVEDVVMLNTPDYMEEINVHLVELPTTVLKDGKPLDQLTEASFKVFDEGTPVKLSKFEHVKDLPLSIGMAVDTSGSMQEKMAQAREAGASFFTNVLRKTDKAFVVGFDSVPHIVQKWTNKIEDVNAGLAKLRPEESTALYDAVVYSLYNFLGVKGQKALILLTDGKDTASKFTFEQALEYAQRAAVPIYAIGIAIPMTDREARSKLARFTSETGGNVYYVDEAKDLSKIYSDVQNELRSQYVLGFYPPEAVKPGGKWREVTVQVAEGRAKTIRGYYP